MTSKLLIDLEPSDCRWPTDCDEWGDRLFCAEPAVVGKSYCRCHYERSRLVLRRPVKIAEPPETRVWTTVWEELQAAE